MWRGFEAIGSALLDISQNEGIALPGVGRVHVVGNSAMLMLLCGTRPEALLDPAGWDASIVCSLADVSGLAEGWHLDRSVRIGLEQPLGGFVGSDLLAGVVHCRLMESRQPALLVDFGTNSEIGLWDGERLWATATAGGPAFEATGIGCGMAAEPGAIHRLSRSPDGVWQGDVLESSPPRGMCGSGLVDMLAIFRSTGEIDERGRLRREPLTLSVGGAELAISKADIDALQRAKAAIAAATEVLLQRAGLGCHEIGTIHVAGSFGEHLDVENAVRIGLLPPVPAACVHLAGNTAVRGALDVVVSDEAETALATAKPGEDAEHDIDDDRDRDDHYPMSLTADVRASNAAWRPSAPLEAEIVQTLPDAFRAAEPGCVADGVPLVRAASFSFCALMNSR